jgi:hypothetical protein
MDPNITRPSTEHTANWNQNDETHPSQMPGSYPQGLPVSASASQSAAFASSSGIKERRRSPRFQCAGKVEFHAEGSDVRLYGALADISLHGCYVEMLTTFPVDTLVTLQIEARGIRFCTRAKVRATYPFVGMGMCFAEIEPGQQAQLNQLLRAIATERALLHPHPNAPSTSDIVASADAWACLEAVSSFFQNNTVLSRDEFFSIAKRVRRS